MGGGDAGGAGNYAIRYDEPRKVPGPSMTRASAFSFAAAGGADDGYVDEGRRFEFQIGKKGIVEFRELDDNCTFSDWEPIVADDTKAQLDFQRSRRPDPTPAPQFEAIAASNDRVFAKVAGTDDYFPS